MDKRSALACILSTGAVGFVSAVAADIPPLPIREARWLAPETLYRGLTREPPECLSWPRDPVERRSVAVGRVAFRTPLLLGGQAVRAGLSCASCHRNGRGNPDFLFPGLSGAPGTADVTSSLMSRHRGDGSVNPKPIPDLAASGQKIGRSRAGGELERFIRGLVVEEFDGPDPPPAVLQGVADYVRAIEPASCKGEDGTITLRRRLEEVEEAVRLAGAYEGEPAELLLAAARSTLGAIDERFRRPGLERSRALLHRMDDELRAIRSGTGDIVAWRRRWPERMRLLLREEARSLYAPAVLRRELRGTAPQEAQQ